MNQIKHIIEPTKLLLCWQTPINNPDRTRRVIGELYKENNKIGFRYLTETSDYKEALKLGLREYEGLPLSRDHHPQAFEVFKKRIPPRSRGDFNKYLNVLRLPVDRINEISDFALLGYSGARLPDDDYSIVNSFHAITPPVEFMLEISGFRHCEWKDNYEEVNIGDSITFESEPTNPTDSRAIKIIYNDKKMGYVSRVCLDSFHKWMTDSTVNVSAVIERKNGTQNLPRIFLFVSVTTN